MYGGYGGYGRGIHSQYHQLIPVLHHVVNVQYNVIQIPVHKRNTVSPTPPHSALWCPTLDLPPLRPFSPDDRIIKYFQ